MTNNALRLYLDSQFSHPTEEGEWVSGWVGVWLFATDKPPQVCVQFNVVSSHTQVKHLGVLFIAFEGGCWCPYQFHWYFFAVPFSKHRIFLGILFHEMFVFWELDFRGTWGKKSSAISSSRVVFPRCSAIGIFCSTRKHGLSCKRWLPVKNTLLLLWSVLRLNTKTSA